MPTPLITPPAATTATNSVESVHALVQRATLLQRRLRDAVDAGYVAGTLFAGSVPSGGGAVTYQQGRQDNTTATNIGADAAAAGRAPGAEFRQVGITEGDTKTANVVDWALQADVTDEAIRRFLIQPLNRTITKLSTQLGVTLDAAGWAALLDGTNGVTQTVASAGVWSSSTVIMREIAVAAGTVEDLGEGYVADTLVVPRLIGAYMASDDKIINAMKRESDTAPGFSGYIGTIQGLNVLQVPSGALPAACRTRAFVCDRKVLGTWADEVPTNVKTIRDEKTRKYIVQAQRVTTPLVLEPGAGCWITGVAA